MTFAKSLMRTSRLVKPCTMTQNRLWLIKTLMTRQIWNNCRNREKQKRKSCKPRSSVRVVELPAVTSQRVTSSLTTWCCISMRLWARLCRVCRLKKLRPVWITRCCHTWFQFWTKRHKRMCSSSSLKALSNFWLIRCRLLSQKRSSTACYTS